LVRLTYPFFLPDQAMSGPPGIGKAGRLFGSATQVPVRWGLIFIFPGHAVPSVQAPTLPSVWERPVPPDRFGLPLFFFHLVRGKGSTLDTLRETPVKKDVRIAPPFSSPHGEGDPPHFREKKMVIPPFFFFFCASSSGWPRNKPSTSLGKVVSDGSFGGTVGIPPLPCSHPSRVL